MCLTKFRLFYLQAKSVARSSTGDQPSGVCKNKTSPRLSYACGGFYTYLGLLSLDYCIVVKVQKLVQSILVFILS